MAEAGPSNAPLVPPGLNVPAKMRRRRTISVLFRIPYICTRTSEGWELVHRREYSALHDSFRYLSLQSSKQEHVVIGWTGEIGIPPARDSKTGLPLADEPEYPHQLSVRESDRRALEEQLKTHDNRFTVPVWLLNYDELQNECAADQGRWATYVERCLYPLLHSSPPKGATWTREEEEAWWTNYFLAMNLFADRVAEFFRPGDIIWIHDYQLMLLPGLLRDRFPDASIGFSLYTPFPRTDALGLIHLRELIFGILGANLVCFQSMIYTRNLISCCAPLSGLILLRGDVIDTGKTYVYFDSIPLGIDGAGVYCFAFGNADVEDRMAHLASAYGSKRIIVGMSHLDGAEGISNRLEAFDLLLTRCPEWIGKVVFLQATNPPNIQGRELQVSKDAADKIGELVSRINGKFGRANEPAVEYSLSILTSRPRFALYRMADVAVMTSLTDDVRAACFEFIVCQKHKEKPGQIILTDRSMTNGNIPGGFHVDAQSAESIASCMHSALNMGKPERKKRHDGAIARVFSQGIGEWSEALLSSLSTVDSSSKAAKFKPFRNERLMMDSFRKATRRLLIFGYDGTLAQAADSSQPSVPLSSVVNTLTRLVGDPLNHVWVVSGRDRAFLDLHFGNVCGLGLVAESSAFIKLPRSQTWGDYTSESDPSWRKEVVKVLGQFVWETPGSTVEHSRAASTWYYRNTKDADMGKIQARHCCEALREIADRYVLKVEVIPQRHCVEVRPRSVHTGEAVKNIASTLPGLWSPQFVLCVGDSETDEDMFHALEAVEGLGTEGAFTCASSPSSRHTHAQWHMDGPSDVVNVLEMFLGYGVLV